jgi:hypothetical protein
MNRRSQLPTALGTPSKNRGYIVTEAIFAGKKIKELALE